MKAPDTFRVMVSRQLIEESLVTGHEFPATKCVDGIPRGSRLVAVTMRDGETVELRFRQTPSGPFIDEPIVMCAFQRQEPEVKG